MIKLTDNRAARMLEQGRVTVTFKSPAGRHITVRATCKAPVEGEWKIVPLAEAKIIWFKTPNSEGGDKIGKYTTGKGFVPHHDADQARIFCAKGLLRFVTGFALPPGLEVWEEDFCGACGLPLTDPESIERGIGPVCYGKITESKHQVRSPHQRLF